jgi:hypothetical protein
MIWKWNPSTHIKMCRLALTKMSRQFNRLINTFPEYFELGVIAPDKIFCDTTNHYFNCTPDKKGRHSGSVVKKVKSEVTLIQEMNSLPDQLIYHPRCADYLKKILNNPLKAIVFELGVISHYVADLHQPFHTDGKYRFRYEETPHKIYEADVRKRFETLNLNIGKRRYRINNIEEYLYSQIWKSNRYYDALIENYFLSPSKVKPDRWEKSKQLTEGCISRAVKSVANIWFLFEESVKKHKKQIHHHQLINKLQKNINPNKNYRLKIYNSGTFSIHRL